MEVNKWDWCCILDPPEIADLLIVLGCTDRNDAADTALKNRAKQALTLCMDGYVDSVLLTGGFPKRTTKGRDCSEAERMKRVFEAVELPSVQIWIEKQSRTTRENAILSHRMMAQQMHEKLAALKTVILVSCDYHMRRALHLFRTEFKGVRFLCCPFVNSEQYRRQMAEREFGILEQLNLGPHDLPSGR